MGGCEAFFRCSKRGGKFPDATPLARTDRDPSTPRMLRYARIRCAQDDSLTWGVRRQALGVGLRTSDLSAVICFLAFVILSEAKYRQKTEG